MNNLHIILYSSFPKYSGGRENWLINILPGISGAFNQIFIYVYKSDRETFYDLSPFTNVVLKEVSGLRKKDLLFYILNFISFKLLFLWDSLIIFRKQVRMLLQQELKPGDTVLATNSIIEMQPAVDIVSKINNVRLVCIAHGLAPIELGNYIPYYRSKFQLMEKRLLPLCDAVLANGYDTQAYLRDVGVNSIVIPNGVNVGYFQKDNPQLNSDVDLASLLELKNRGVRIILMVATLRKIKGIEYLLEAGKLIKDKGLSNFRIVFVGKGDQLIYKNKAFALGIQNRVLFLGEKKNIPSYLHSADVVVCLSGGGGMSLSALEAMAAGKPIVAWDTPVYQQLIMNMQEGYLVKYPDLDELAEGINFVLENPETAAMFAANAQQKVNQYDWPNVSTKLLEKLV